MSNKKDEPKWKTYWDNNVHEDQDDILTICELANREILRQFNMRSPHPEILADIYHIVFNVMREKVLEQQNTRKSFNLNVANRFEIGFDNREDPDEEKAGNFMIYIRHLENKKKQKVDNDTDKSVELCTQWNSENIIYQTKFIEDICVSSLKEIKDQINCPLESDGCIMPMFITIHEQMLNYIQIKRKQSNDFEYEINFIDCFFATARETVNGVDDISYRPNIDGKLTFKSDLKATSGNE